MAFLQILSLASLITGIAGSCIQGTHLERRQTTSSYGYHSNDGPVEWFRLNPAANRQCARGRNQTPINIVPGSSFLKTLSSSEKPSPSYGTVRNVKCENLGTTIQCQLGSPRLTYKGTTYTLLQFHFHTPSEHHFQKEHFPLEAHLVHERTDPLPDGSKPLMVLGFFLEVLNDALIDLLGSSEFELFAKVLREADRMPNKGQSVTFDSMNFGQLENIIRTKEVYEYSGSLTTPPCAENVNWLVYKDPVGVEARTYKEGKRVMGTNNRPIQNNPGQVNAVESVCNALAANP